MTNKNKPSTSAAAPEAAVGVRNTDPRKLDQDTPDSNGGRGQKTDRPGFDLGGSTGDTHAGTGLGLGEDAFDTPGERRLPGRQLDNKLTIPRWSGPGQKNATAPTTKLSADKAHTESKPNKGL